MKFRRRERILRTSGGMVLALFCALFAFPFLWMFFATFKNNLEIFTPFPLLPETFNFQYYSELLSGKYIPYLRQFLNSLFVAGMQTFLALLLSVPAGFVFAQYSFRAKKILFALALLVILIPRQVMALPLFLWMHSLHLLDSLWAVVFPGMVTGIGLLYFTQVFKKLPGELLDLARSEGCSEKKLLWISLPMVRPAIATYGLIHFIFAWHEHLIPLVMLSSRSQLTVPLALSSLYGDTMQIPFALLMVGSFFTVIPVILLYLLIQKQFKTSLSELASA